MNLGDAYAGSGRGAKPSENCRHGNSRAIWGTLERTWWRTARQELAGPCRGGVAFALQDDGWYLRSDVIWHKCLSGGTRVYAKHTKGEMPMTIREMSRLNSATVKLWAGQGWVQLQSIVETEHEETLEIRFRNGQSVSCSPEHRWPTDKGIAFARYLRLGDVVPNAKLPDTNKVVEGIPDDVAFIIGLYIAEGSKGKKGRQIQFSLHSKESELTKRIQQVAAFYGGHCSVHDYGNIRHVNVHSKVLSLEF